MSFSRYSVAVVTPFERDGGLNEGPVRAHLDRLAGLGVPAFLVAGSTGEQHSMTVEEKSKLYRWAVAGSVPVYAGVAAVRTSDAVTLARAAEAAGAQGILLGFPPYVRLTDLDARAYVRAVAAATALPLMLYNNPLRTAFDLLPATLFALADEIPSVQAVKETGDPSRARAIREALGNDFGIFSGSDRSIVDHWALGYNGLTSVAGNLWALEMGWVVEALAAGKVDRARTLLESLTPALRTVIETQLPSSLKFGLRTLGLPGGWCREPLGHLDRGIEADIQAVLAPLADPDAPSALPFWDDDHISAQMLAAHLDPSHDAASRRPELRQRTLEWLDKEVFRGRGDGLALLDLGCGPGLYAAPWARRGYRVTGMDLSRRSIAYAREQAVREGLALTYRQGNYLELDESDQYDVVTMIWCDMGALTKVERADVLSRILRALKPGGVLVFDVWGADFGVGLANQAHTTPYESGFWSPSPHKVTEETFCHPGVLARRVTVQVDGDQPRVYRLRDYWFTDPELVDLLAKTGFDSTRLQHGILGPAETPEGKVTFVTTSKPLRA